jgi:hypothetical protein
VLLVRGAAAHSATLGGRGHRRLSSVVRLCGSLTDLPLTRPGQYSSVST